MTEYKDFLSGLGSSLAVSGSEDGVSLDCMNSYKNAIAKRDALEDFESAVSVSWANLGYAQMLTFKYSWR